jgi:hypothetical protein
VRFSRVWIVVAADWCTRVVVDMNAAAEIDALPDEALTPLAEALSVLQVAPDRDRPYNAAFPERPMRELVFGAGGRGVLTYLIMEHDQVVHLLLVDWFTADP